jgi:hypothetical protein
MAQLGRPPTIKEFLIQSILGWREPAPTLVDPHEFEEPPPPTGALPRQAVQEAVLEEEALPPPRGSQASIVFDLAVPRTGSHPSFADGELQRDTLPSPPPSVPDAW